MSSLVNVAYIGLGSNLGDRFQNLRGALQKIQNEPALKILNLSSFYETEPLVLSIFEKMEWFWNAVLQVLTSWSAQELLSFLLNIETRLGRPKTRKKWVARVIDLDLLFFNDEIRHSQSLTLPHPELHKRRFVLEPMVEIAPEWVHPLMKKTMIDLLAELEDSSRVTPLFRLFLKDGMVG